MTSPHRSLGSSEGLTVKEMVQKLDDRLTDWIDEHREGHRLEAERYGAAMDDALNTPAGRRILQTFEESRLIHAQQTEAIKDLQALVTKHDRTIVRWQGLTAGLALVTVVIALATYLISLHP